TTRRHCARTSDTSTLCMWLSTTHNTFFGVFRPPPLYSLFPTRRSSDLRGHRPGQEPDGARQEDEQVPGAPQLHRPVRRAPGRPRSEEHTSELQSRENLVCRLLLEKKKKSIPMTRTTKYD